MSESYNEHEDEIVEELPKEGEEGYDEIDWKALAQKNHGIAQRKATKLAKLKADGVKPNGEEPVKKAGAETVELDKGDRAILRAAGITDAEEVDLVKKIMKETGKTDVDDVLDTPYFKSVLKEHKEAKAADDALPNGSKRTGNTSRDSVEYWLAKGELPPTDQPELRTKVVNAKIAKEKSGSQFSAHPIG